MKNQRLLLMFSFFIFGCSISINGFCVDYSTPEKILQTAFYAMQNSLYKDYWNCLSEKARMPYGETEKKQLNRLKNKFNIKKKIKSKNFEYKNSSIIIKKVIYSLDKKAAIVIYDSKYKDVFVGYGESAVILLEQGQWKLGLMEYLDDPEVLDKFQKSDSSEFLFYRTPS